MSLSTIQDVLRKQAAELEERSFALDGVEGSSSEDAAEISRAVACMRNVAGWIESSLDELEAQQEPVATPAPAKSSPQRVMGVGEVSEQMLERARAALAAANAVRDEMLLTQAPTKLDIVEVSGRAVASLGETLESLRTYGRKLDDENQRGNVLWHVGRFEAALAQITSIDNKPLRRDDFEATTRDLCNAAVRMGLIDAFGLGLIVHRHGTDSASLLTALDDVAENLRPLEPAICSRWAALRQAVAWLRGGDPLAGKHPDGRAKAIVERHVVRV